LRLAADDIAASLPDDCKNRIPPIEVRLRVIISSIRNVAMKPRYSVPTDPFPATGQHRDDKRAVEYRARNRSFRQITNANAVLLLRIVIDTFRGDL
jgi:hypothetical protein